MPEGRQEFERQLRELDFVPESRTDARTVFPYKVRGGRFGGQEIRLGFEVPPDFPRTPPRGPHISPPLLPLNPGAPNHPDRVHPSEFGPDWQYWSRPYPGWKGRETAATYLAYIEHLLSTA